MIEVLVSLLLGYSGLNSYQRTFVKDTIHEASSCKQADIDTRYLYAVGIGLNTKETAESCRILVELKYILYLKCNKMSTYQNPTGSLEYENWYAKQWTTAGL